MRKVGKLRKKETTNKTNLHELSGFAAALSGGCFAIFRNLREAHDRTTARWPTAPWMLARASAKRVISHESHHLARCSKWAHLHFSSACASMQTRCASLCPCALRTKAHEVSCAMRPMCPMTRPSLSSLSRATARKPCKGDQITAGGERSVTPGYQGTR